MNGNTIDFESILHACGYKLTDQRQAILNIIKHEKDKHLGAEEIYREVKKMYPRIGLATVYRNLQLFEKLGLVHHIMLDDNHMRVQIFGSQEKRHHHHLICESCGEVIDVEEDMPEVFEKKLLSEKGFVVKNYRVQFFGTCEKCSNKENTSIHGG